MFMLCTDLSFLGCAYALSELVGGHFILGLLLFEYATLVIIAGSTAALYKYAGQTLAFLQLPGLRSIYNCDIH